MGFVDSNYTRPQATVAIVSFAPAPPWYNAGANSPESTFKHRMASPAPSFFRRIAAPLRLLLWLFVLVGAVAGIRSASHRWFAENANRRVEIAVDFAELRTLAASSGVPITAILQRFKAAGATSVVVQEETVAGLEESKRLRVVMASDSRTQLAGGNMDEAALREADVLLPRIADALGAKTPLAMEAESPRGDVLLTVNGSWQAVRGYGVGLNPGTVADVRGAGLGIVGRVGNCNGVSPGGLAWTLAELKAQGVSTVLFSGDEILGYKGYIAPQKTDPAQPSTMDILRSLGLFYGAIEFGKQKGDAELSKAAPDRVVRVHTITGGEMLTATAPDAVQRFALAARERNIRLLFVRLFLDEPDAVAFNTKYVAKIVKALENGGLTTGTAHGYRELGTGFVPRLLIGLGIGAGLLLLCDAVTRFLAGGVHTALGALSWLVAIGLVGLAASPSLTGVKLAALAAALIFPSLGLLRSDLLHNEIRTGAIGRFVFACVVTALGIVCVVGLLADRSFLVKADAFVGIKATLAVPVLLVALVYALDLRARDDRTFAQAVAATRSRLLRLLAEPILIWQVVAGVLALVLVFVILSRSGNEGVGVSGAELKIRSLLDRFLFARPRFKDMFGHAAMVLSLLMYTKTRRRDWAMPLFVLGAFGQVSLLNAFCHLHTPLAVSLWRAGLGIVIGGTLGVIAFVVLDRFALRRLRKLFA